MQDLLQPNTVNIILNTVTTILKLLIHAISNTMVKDSIESKPCISNDQYNKMKLLLIEKCITVTEVVSVSTNSQDKKLLI